jgi:hypothetical protein
MQHFETRSHHVNKSFVINQSLMKNKDRFGIIRILEFLDVCLTELKNNQISLNKFSHRFLVPTKLFCG